MENKNKLPFLSVASLCSLMLALVFPFNARVAARPLATAGAQCPAGYSGTYPACLATVPGCTNPSAVNYSPNATADDGSCRSGAPALYGCTLPAAANYNPNATADDGSCKSGASAVYGCTLPAAANYNPSATADDGSCKSGASAVYGCTLPAAANYNPNATADDGSCRP